MKIDILISTIDAGIEKIKDILLPYREDVNYIVSHQYRDKKFLPIPEELLREDVIVSQIPGQGLTKSRNNAIKLATGDICVIADDDVRYRIDFIDTIKRGYSENMFDLICFKIFTGDGQPEYKNYPDSIVKINSLNDFTPSSIEITFKRKPIIAKQIFFDENFGMGSWLNGGGEPLFLHDAVKAKLDVGFIPKYIVQHPYESTIKSFPKYHERRVRVAGALDARFNGWKSIPKSLLGTMKYMPDLMKNKKNPFKYFSERLSGAIYIFKAK